MILFVFLFIGNVYGQGFTLDSEDISGQLSEHQVYNAFGCSGNNISPHLSWHNAPRNTKSFAVTVYDPDAPSGSGWWHWLIFDIPEDITWLPRNAGDLMSNLAPLSSIQSITDFGMPGFGGACPPVGDKAHGYIFTVYALDIAKLGLTPNTPAAMVGFMLNQHTISKASLIAYYER